MSGCRYRFALFANAKWPPCVVGMRGVGVGLCWMYWGLEENVVGGCEVSEFAAVVTDIREESRRDGRQRWQIALDHTEFDEGDTGVLEAMSRSGARLTVPVLAVEADAEGEVWHVVEKPLAAGTEVTGKVTAKRV